MRTTFVGISIELRATYRHTDRSIVLFSGILPREVVRLTGGLPRQESELARNDREFDKFPICRAIRFGHSEPGQRGSGASE